MIQLPAVAPLLVWFAFSVIPVTLSDPPTTQHLALKKPAAEVPFKAEPALAHSFPHKMDGYNNLAQVLKSIGLEASDTHKIVESASGLYNLNRIQPNMTFFYELKQSPYVSLKVSPTLIIDLHKTGQEWEASARNLKPQIDTVAYQGQVDSSLWNSAVDSGMDPQLIIALTDVFAWQIDFSREVRKKDRWRLIVEKVSVNGEFVRWGQILAAEYMNNDRSYEAIHFDSKKGQKGYFNSRGKNLKKVFLKSPLKYGRISSRFSRRRFHPIRKVYRPHLGVDYAAPRGTPIRAVGDGTVKILGRRGGAGKMIRIRHNSSYETAYMHLSRYGRGLKKGSKVIQGQVIGYVGSTGLATGPHLHFEFYKNGQYVDPLAIEFPAAASIPPELRANFKTLAQQRLKLLPAWHDRVALTTD